MKYKYIQKRKEGEARKRGKKGRRRGLFKCFFFFVVIFLNCCMKKRKRKILSALTRNIKCLILALNKSRLFKQSHRHVDALKCNCICMLRPPQICNFSVMHSLKCHLESSFSASLLRISNEIELVVIYMMQLIGSLHMSNYI